MKKGKISFKLTEQAYGQIAQSIRALDSLLTFAINLTVDERHKLYKMGDKSIAFVDKSIRYADERPDLVPTYLDLSEFKEDYTLSKQLKDLLLLLEPVTEKLSDTYLSAGSDAFLAARKLYSAVKAAAYSGAPGSDTIVSDLRKRFSRKNPNSQGKKDNQENANQESNE